jgi:hypothetical protein
MEQQNDLFNVGMDERGKEIIRKIYPMAKSVFVVGIIVQLAFIFVAISNYIKFSRLTPFNNSALSSRFLTYLIYVVLGAVLFFLQGSFFLKFASISRQSLENNDSNSFNESFSWVYKGLYLSLISIVLQGFYFILSYFVFNLY